MAVSTKVAGLQDIETVRKLIRVDCNIKRNLAPEQAEDTQSANNQKAFNNLPKKTADGENSVNTTFSARYFISMS